MTTSVDKIRAILEAEIATATKNTLLIFEENKEIAGMAGLRADQVKIWAFLTSDDAMAQVVIDLPGDGRSDKIVIDRKEPAFIEFKSPISYRINSETEKMIIETDWEHALDTALPDSGKEIAKILNALGMSFEPRMSAYGQTDNLTLSKEMISTREMAI